MASIMTNTSAMTALKVLRQTETALGTTQQRISTGLKVNSAKDDASTWAIAQGIKSDVSTFKTIGEGLTMASNALETAMSAATTIKKEIDSIQQNIAKAQIPGADKTAIQAAIDSSLVAIDGAKSGSFNGTNLVQGTDQLKVLSSISRDAGGTATANFISVDRHDLTMTAGGGLSMLKGLNVSDDALATNANAGKQQLAVDLNTAAATAGGKLSFSYTSASGQAKAVTLDYANLATKADVGNNFVSTFGDALKADGISVETAGDGTLTFTSTATLSKVGQVDAGAGFTAVGGANQKSQTTLEFVADANPEAGKEFTLSVSAGGKDYGYKLRMVEGGLAASGAVLGVDADGNKIISVNKDLITATNTLAEELASALTVGAATEFAGAASATIPFGVAADATGAKLVVESLPSEDGTVPAKVNFFQQPTADFSKLQATIDAAAKVATSAAQAFGTAQSQAASQKEFLSAMIDSLETGVGALIDADITAESARLSALQTQQQLATQSLSIANQSNQLVMSLFR
jgi:flagellin